MIEIFKNSFRYFRQLVLRFRVLKTTPFNVNSNSILIIAPHPDDETFGCAGLIAKKVKAGAHISVAFLTYGENSLDESPDTEIATNRQKTSETVCSVLGVKNVYYCGFSDSNIPRRGMDDYTSGVEKIVQLIEQIDPKEVFCTHDSEGWSDHTAAAELTFDALKRINKMIALYYYWVWVWLSIPLKKTNLLDFNNTFYLPITDVMDQKCLAISTYLSNVDAQGNPYCGELPKMFLKAFEWPYEVYEKVEYK
ncbi:MAG: PIG-L deacetylase family protein [Sulfuricurvum sp.]|nr:PIG-L deacetylase family protein [Sulfuricurvum sp.]